MEKIIKLVIKGYRNVIIRGVVTIVTITFTHFIYTYYISKSHTTGTVLYATFQNTWLISAYIITTLITGVMFICIYRTATGEVKNAGLWGLFALIFFIILTVIAIFKIHSSSKLLIFIPPVCAFIVLLVDYKLSKAGLERLKQVYPPFDLGVLIGVLAVAILQMINKNTDPNLIYGFGGGASAFQLIMANVVFDPSNYLQNINSLGDNYQKN